MYSKVKMFNLLINVSKCFWCGGLIGSAAINNLPGQDGDDQNVIHGVEHKLKGGFDCKILINNFANYFKISN